MTTPEKLRRRQRRESAGLLILGLVMTVTTIYDSNQRDKQKDEFQECITSVVTELTDSLTARSNLTEPDARSVRELIRDLLKSKTEADSRKAISAYNATQVEIAKVRKSNPIPPFPDGTCDHK